MSCDIAIKVKNLSKYYEIYDKPVDRLKQVFLGKYKTYYREFRALNNISFEVKVGDALGIIGKNGSGKSTLLQLLCGTLEPSQGDITINGRVAALLELGAGFNLEFSGRENVYLYAKVLGLTDKEISQKYDDILAFADIGEFIEQPIKSYSSGMVVRLAFAVIAHVDADILIIDEALAVGDAIFVQKCNRFIRNFRAKGTLLFVSHSNQAVLDLCDHAIWLHQGLENKFGLAVNVIQSYAAYINAENSGVKTSVTVSQSNPTDKLLTDFCKIEHRKQYLEDSPLKYNLQLYGFNDFAANWGAGGAEVLEVRLLTPEGIELNSISECQDITVRVICKSNIKLAFPVIGFMLRNSRGVELLAENTYISSLHINSEIVSEGAEFYADFTFFLPYLASGDYFFGAAIADGVPGEHVQHHRVDEALKIVVTNSHVFHGLFSMPLISSGILKNEQ